MRFEERQIRLKNGTICTLRPTTSEYAQEMIDYMKLTAAETPFLLRNPDEVRFTLEKERELLDYIYRDEHSVMMLALVDGKVVGNSSINGMGEKRRVWHRCSLAIALKKEYWGMGIGTAMIRYLTELAKQIGYEQMELEVVDGNDRAKALYEKCGFVETGRHINAMKYDDGTYRDEIIMYKSLRE